MIIINAIKEYGIFWIIGRIIYSIKMRLGYYIRILPIKDFEYFTDNKVTSEFLGKDDLFKSLIRDKFIKFDIDSINKYYNLLSVEEKQNIIRTADNVLSGRIVGFGGIELCYGKNIDWFINPINGENFDNMLHWSKIPDFDNAGDIKLGWEVSRFFFVYDLVKAYLITEDIKYVKCFWNLFEDWCCKNPPEKGINWKCSQEISIRLLSITTAIYFFIDAYEIDKKYKEIYFKFLKSSLNHIYKNRNYALKFIKNDHAFVEMFALSIFGDMMNGKSNFYNKIKKVGSKNFEKEILRQIYSDGGYKQNSFNYHRLVLQLASIYYKFKQNDLINKREIKHLISKSIFFLNSAIMNDLGEVPNYGPSDSAIIFPFSKDILNFKKIVNFSLYLVNNELAYNKKTDCEDIFWFNDITCFETVEISHENSYTKSGYHYLRNSAWQIFFRAGYQHHRPYHDDIFHVDVWYKGYNLLCDMGTYSYNSHLKNSNHYMSVFGHNTMSVYPNNKFKRIGNFLVINWKNAFLLEYRANIFVKARMYFNKSTICERAINIESNGLFIEDIFSSNKEKEFIVNYNLNINGIEEVSKLHYKLILKDNKTIYMAFKCENLNFDIQINKTLNEDDSLQWLSKSYFLREPVVNLKLHIKSTQNAKILTKFYDILEE